MSATNSSYNLHEIFIQNVSHELKTPLAVMLGFTQLLREGNFGELAPEQEEAATVILNRTEALRTVVERICMLIGIEGQEGHFAPINLGDLVCKSVRQKQEAINQAQMTITVQITENATAVLGDFYQLEHMLECLLDNAIKFNDANGEIIIQVEAEEKWVQLTISDSGIGLTNQEIEKILSNRFYQVDGSTTRHYGGFGLGLTLVKSIVQAHKGQLTIESQSGNGSHFIIKLPIASPGNNHVMPAVSQVQRVLVVDDEENVGLIVKNGLKKLPNCDVHLAHNAEQALRLCQQLPFDLMITDYMMPGRDGLDLATQIRQMYPETVILMLTAYNNDTLHRQASQVSVQRILNKPIAISEIRQAVSQALDQPNLL